MLLEGWLDPDFKALLPLWPGLISAPPAVPYGPQPLPSVPMPPPVPGPSTAKPPTPPKPPGPPGADPPKPKPGDLSDFLGALYKTEVAGQSHLRFLPPEGEGGAKRRMGDIAPKALFVG